jgi:hypothetical protein
MKINLALIFLVFLSCANDEWQEHYYWKGEFSVLLPPYPTETTENVSTDVGIIEMNQITAEDNEIKIVITYADYPIDYIKNNKEDVILNKIQLGSLRYFQTSLNGKILRDTTISIYDRKAKFIKILSHKKKYFADIITFLVENRFFQLSILVPNRQGYDDKITKFYESFRLKK